MRLNLAGVHGAFSPGVSMSPGTFYGRAGDVPGPNPHINAAVGAPVHVHVHSPLGMVHIPQQQQQQQGQAGPMPHGAYFYAMSSPRKGPPTGMEPQGYFDPMYFPVGMDAENGTESQSKSQAMQASGLANEVVRDGVGKEESGERGTSEKDSGSIKEDMSLPDGSTNGMMSTSGGGEMDSAMKGLSNADIDTTISRTHSVGHTKEPTSKVLLEHGLETRVGVLDLKLPEQQRSSR